MYIKIINIIARYVVTLFLFISGTYILITPIIFAPAIMNIIHDLIIQSGTWYLTLIYSGYLIWLVLFCLICALYLFSLAKKIRKNKDLVILKEKKVE